MNKSIKVVIVMGSKSDLPVMKTAGVILDQMKIKYETHIVSAHRTPKLLQKCIAEWEVLGVKIIIAGAGGAAHLPGMLASFSILPVIGVPIKSSAMNGLDALLSIAQMPRGVPVATVAVDNSTNAALLAAQILGTNDDPQGLSIRKKVSQYKKTMSVKVLRDKNALSSLGVNQFLRKQK